MTAPAQKVAVIIPCAGDSAQLDRCLKAVEKQDVTFNFDLVVVDSFWDESVVRCVENFKNARLVRGDNHTLSAGAARNEGVNATRAEILAFCDADCAPESCWLAACTAALDGGNTLVTGPIIDLIKRPVAIADNLLQFVDFSPGRPAGTISHAPGCSLAVRRSAFLRVGGFVEHVGEDVLFSQRVAPSGAYFETRMRQRHQGRRTVREMVFHHRAFGLARGRFGLMLKPWQGRIGSWRIMLPIVVLKRFSYLLQRTIRYRRSRLPLFVILSPLLVIGLWAWAIGFRRGLQSKEQ